MVRLGGNDQPAPLGEPRAGDLMSRISGEACFTSAKGLFDQSLNAARRSREGGVECASTARRSTVRLQLTRGRWQRMTTAKPLQGKVCESLSSYDARQGSDGPAPCGGKALGEFSVRGSTPWIPVEPVKSVLTALSSEPVLFW